jgi:leucyl-tRNA synthetase
MHLLYARFITKALRDMDYLNFDEPFLSLTHQGLILGPDGLKMSKSKGNTISPDDYIKDYGADVFRMYLMFGFGYTEGGAWSDDGIKSVGKFVDRIERTLEAAREVISSCQNDSSIKATTDAQEKELNFWRHTAIKGVSEDADKMQFNTAIARLMELTNALHKYLQEPIKNSVVLTETVVDFLKLLSPFAPHFAEEQWNLLGNDSTIFNEKWPEFNPSALIKDEVEIAIQINGKIKVKIDVPSNLDEEGIKVASLENEIIKEQTDGKAIVKVIVIKGRLVNIVVK